MFAKQAERDWEQFLLMRAKELTKGEKHVHTGSEKTSMFIEHRKSQKSVTES